MYVHALVKSATAERTDLRSLSGRVWNLTVEILYPEIFYLCSSDDLWRFASLPKRRYSKDLCGMAWIRI